MNKGRRQELKMLRYKRRMKIRQAKERSMKAYLNGDSVPTNNYAFRTTGKPCSCAGCSPYKYNRAKEKKKARKIPELVNEFAVSRGSLIRNSPFITKIEGDEEEEDAINIILADYFGN